MAAAEVGVVDADAAAAVGSVVEQSALSSSTSSWWASVHSRSRIWANTKKKIKEKDDLIPPIPIGRTEQSLEIEASWPWHVGTIEGKDL